MSERPTPEQAIATYFDEWGALKAQHILGLLESHGYRIVHPDDVPVGDWVDWPADRNHGWNLCRNLIFGDLNAD